MEHFRIATYDLEDGTSEASIEHSHDVLRTALADQPGFIRQSHVGIGHLRYISISIWRASSEADDAVGVAERWATATTPEVSNFRFTTLRQMIPEGQSAAI